MRPEHTSVTPLYVSGCLHSRCVRMGIALPWGKAGAAGGQAAKASDCVSCAGSLVIMRGAQQRLTTLERKWTGSYLRSHEVLLKLDVCYGVSNV